MNARAAIVYFAKAVVEVLGTIWLSGDDSSPPTLELRLSNGSYVKVGYDIDYSHRLLWFAADKHEEFVSATPAMTGLTPDQLAPFEAQAEEAVRSWASNQRAEFEADAYNFEDGS